MRKLGAGLAIAAALLLGGCASSSGAESDSAAAPAGETAAPITMAPTVAADDTNTDAFGEESDTYYLAAVREAWRGDVPSDESLLGAGQLACDSAPNAASADEIRVVEGEGEDAAWNNSQLVAAAIQIYCPEYDN